MDITRHLGITVLILGILTAVLLFVAEPWAEAQDDMPGLSFGEKSFLTDNREQTAALLVGHMAGHNDNNVILLTYNKSLDLSEQDIRTKCFESVPGTDWCLPPKGSVHHTDFPRIIILGSNYDDNSAQDESVHISTSYSIHHENEACSDGIVLTPPKYSGVPEYSAGLSNCNGEINGLNIIGEWKWRINGTQIGGSIHVIDMHSVFAPYMDYLK